MAMLSSLRGCIASASRRGGGAFRRDQTMDAIAYRIVGDDLQFVEFTLAPGQSAIGEPGSMMYMDEGLTMDTVLGDGAESRFGVIGRLGNAIKRAFTGESLFSSVFHNPTLQPQRVAFAAPYPGKIVPVDLAANGGTLICQKGAYLCAARGVRVGIAFKKRLRVGFFGGEGFIMQKLSGDGVAFIHASGTLTETALAPGAALKVDTGCLVALQTSVSYDIRYVGKIKTALFGGEGLFFAHLKGPGTVWLQSLPIRRLSSGILGNAFKTRNGIGARLYLVFIIIAVLIALFSGPTPGGG
jgi:uncharacterized protein (TIGR00266 family)